jgi:hypothetical protein
VRESEPCERERERESCLLNVRGVERRNAKLMSGVATVSKTKELKTCYGANQSRIDPVSFGKSPSHASGSSFQREETPSKKDNA